MTPIKLNIRGINSFRDEEIDFQKLTEQGVFGIFGNTGSGKSTILDAMSLALYGVNGVARGSNEFITLGLNEAVILFEFSIKGETYKVERSFKNKKDTNIANAGKATLYNTAGVVLKTGNTEVTKGCIAITNLNQDNFFRTIVLPQGNFSNFLKLKGVARNKMLAEIFNLEEYGDKLNKKIKSYKDTLETNQALINGLAASYSGASKEACDAIKGELDLTQKELDKLNEDQKTINKDFDEIQKNWELQQNKETLETEYNELKSKLTEFTETKTKNEFAEKANLIKEFLVNKNTAVKAYDVKSASLTIVKDELEKLQAREDEINKSYNLASANNDKISSLSSEKTKLERAIDDEKKLNSLNSSIKTIIADIEKTNNEKDDLEKQKSASKETQDKLSKVIKDLESKIAANTVRPQARKNVEDGLEILRNITQSEKDETDKKGEITVTTNSIGELELKLEGFKKVEEKLKTSNSSTEDSDALGKLKEELAKTKKLAQKHIVSCLKSECIVGEPCPVCGTHLAEMPVFSDDDDNTDYSSIITKIEDDISVLETKIQAANNKHLIDVTSNEKDITNTENSINEKTKHKTELQAQLAGIQDALNAHKKELDELKVATEIKDFTASDKDNKAKDSALDKFTKELAKNNKLIEPENAKIEKLGDDINALIIKINELGTKKEAETSQVDSINNDLTTNFGKDYNISEMLTNTNNKIKTFEKEFTKSKESKEKFDKDLNAKTNEHTQIEAEVGGLLNNKNTAIDTFNTKLEASPFASEEELNSSIIDEETLKVQIDAVKKYFELLTNKKSLFDDAVLKLGTIVITKAEFEEITNKKNNIQGLKDEKTENLGSKTKEYKTALIDLKKSKILSVKQAKIQQQIDFITTITNSLSGHGFINYMCTNRLKSICKVASVKLREITDNELELLVNADNEFKIKHISQGGGILSPTTLSGGQTFMVSLTLALALSQEIQLESATSLDLFFLDEGFDTLDDDCLDTVMEVIETLTQSSGTSLKIGVISHKTSLKSHIAVQLHVTRPNSTVGSSAELIYA